MTARKIWVHPTHEAAEAFWDSWEKSGKEGRLNRDERTWDAINDALEAGGIRRALVSSAIVPVDGGEETVEWSS